MNWNRKFLRYLNVSIPLIVILLIMIGLLIISSAVEVNQHSDNSMLYLQKQAIAAILGILLIIIIQFFDYRIFKEYSWVIYICTIILLGVILGIGQTISGGRRWIDLGLVSFQPSELAKILVILVLAAVIDDNADDLGYLTVMFKPSLVAFIPFILILLQNDLGTSLVILFIYIVMMFAGGGNVKFMAFFFGGGFIMVVLMIVSHFFIGTPLPFLKEYQLNRLIVFINPNVDPYGIGYNIIQSKIALGSGELFGKGLFAGTQNQLNFLPEKHTDFIFSVIGEEFGFIGVAVVLILFLFLLWQFLNVARNAKDQYGYLVVVGITAMFLFHILENVGMTMGMMPITGIPLPFISYGGTFMVSSLIAVGIVININLRKNKIMF